MLNVLAAGGRLKRIQLFHSYHLINYAILNGHESEISCLTFHPSKPTVLFSGDRQVCSFKGRIFCSLGIIVLQNLINLSTSKLQGNICVWDINVPSRTKYCHYLLMRLTCPRPSFYPVLGLVVMPNYDTLLASCGDGIFAWTINDFRLLDQGKKRYGGVVHLVFPNFFYT